AVVVKSLVAEHISGEVSAAGAGECYPAAADYLNSYISYNGLERHLDIVRAAKKRLSIPVIASINAKSGGEWLRYASRMAEAGADALELNLFYMPTSASESAVVIERRYLDTAAEVIAATDLPVAVKIPNRFTNPLNIVQELYNRGAKAVVMFNRMWEPDIDINTMTVGSTEILSDRTEMRTLVRWIAMTAGAVNAIDIAASTGIDSGESLVKVLLSGASAACVCSAVYKGGDKVIAAMLDTLREWMERNSYTDIARFKGRMAHKPSDEDSLYERAQFMKYFSSYR
ncbi:MAG: diguanylate cyclase, partial [Rikenellaceae bacterium]|nr:diguanylate cyclase [Rikenellaceae bacterium]